MIRRCLFAFAAAISLLCVGGCMGWFIGNPSRLKYVLDKGDSESIATWTLEQTDGEKVADGLGALVYRVVDARNDEDKAKHAIFWCVEIVKNIEAQPPDRVWPSRRGDLITTRWLVRAVFTDVAISAYQHPIAEALLYRLRPRKYPYWLPEWEEAEATLRLPETRPSPQTAAKQELGPE
jgi:hypothetical protein